MRLAVVLVLAAALACGGRTPVMPEPVILRLTLRTPDPDSTESVTAAGGEGQIAVRATFIAPTPCQIISGDLDQTDRDLTMRISISSSGTPCVQVIGRFAYDAWIGGLSAGRYSLKVVHAYPSTGWPTRTVLDVVLDVR